MSAPWPRLTLGELTKSTRPICYGVLKPGPYVPSGVPLLRIQDLAGNVVQSEAVHRIGHDLNEEFRRSRLQGGEVLLSIQGTIGRAAICPAALSGANISRTLALIAPDERLSPPFLRYYLLHLESTGEYRTSGSTRASLNISEIRAMRVPVPPLSEQMRTVEILDDHLSRIESGVALLDRSLSSVAAMKSAVYERVLRNPCVTGGGVSSEIEYVPLTRVATLASGPAFKSALFGGPDEGIRLLRGDNIEPGRLRWDRTRTWPESLLVGYEHLLIEDEDIILAMDRPVISTGLKLAMATLDDLPSLLVQRVARIRCTPLMLPNFMALALRSRSFIRHLRLNEVGTQLPHITLKAIGSFKVPLLPLEEQRRIASEAQSILDGGDRLRAASDLSTARADRLRGGLLAAAFAGLLARGTATREGATGV